MLQCVAVCCSLLQCVAASVDVSVATRDVYTATHCNTLHHAASHCNTLQHSATLCNTLQYTAKHRNTPQHTATPCNTLQHTATHRITPQHTTTHRNTLQYVRAAIRDMRPHSQQHPSRTLHLSAGRGRLGRKGKGGGGADAGPEAGASHGVSLGVSLGVSPESRSLNESASEPPMLGNLSRDAVLGHCNTLQPTATQFSSLQSLDAVLGHSLYASVGSIESLKAPSLTVCASLSPLSLSCMHVCGAACK